MHDRSLAEILGQDAVVTWLGERLERDDVRLMRLTGSAGSGKSHIARQIAADWREAGHRCVLAVGDDEHSWRELYPLLSGLSRAHRNWLAIATTGGRSAAQVADTVAAGTGVGGSVFDLLTAPFRQRTERALRPYAPLERDVILDLKRFARSHRVLLVAENAHWWDADSLRLLGELASDPLREVIPQLRSVVVLMVDTAEEQPVAAPEAFDALVARCVKDTKRISRCRREDFAAVLDAFGAPPGLPEPVVTDLFGATHGHLKLAEQVAAYEKHAGKGTLPLDEDYLATLISERLASLGTFHPDVAELLARAAVLGLSCTEQDLECVTDTARKDLRALVERAESIGFLERREDLITFSHDVIRSAILVEQTGSRLEELHSKLAECLAILRPGDYEARAQALLRGGDRRRAREMVALAAVAQLRRGIASAKVLRRVALEFPEDGELRSYVEAVAAGYSAIATGAFDAVPPGLRAPLSSDTTLMVAERNYVAAIFYLRQQSQAGADEARALLASWGSAFEGEAELALRFLALLQQAQVLSEMFDEARDTDMRMEQTLSARSHYDVDAKVMRQVQNRRAGAIETPEAAEDRITRAVEFFERGTGDASRDQLELFRSLTNLCAIKIRLDKNRAAFGHALDAERIAVESFEVGHRLDVLAHNLVLAGYRSGALDVEEAVARQALVVRNPERAEDDFLQRCNLAAYLLLASRDDEAAAELARLEQQMHANEVDETYLVYYWGALSVASAAVTGDTAEALGRHRAWTAFVEGLRWPTAAYIRRRHELLLELLPTLRGDEDRAAADRLLIDSGPMKVGRAWSYYARLIPCCELSFWSDS